MHCIFAYKYAGDSVDCNFEILLSKEFDVDVGHRIEAPDSTTYCRTGDFRNCPRWQAIVRLYRIKHGMHYQAESKHEETTIQNP